MKRQLLILMATMFMVGCQTNLNKDGIYGGDSIRYNAEKTIVEAYDILDTFVEWEYQNRRALPPEVTKVADNIRGNAKDWIATAVHLNEVYKISPTKENGEKLEGAIRILRQALSEATKYIK